MFTDCCTQTSSKKKVDSQFSEIAQKIYKMHKEVILMHQQIDNHNW